MQQTTSRRLTLGATSILAASLGSAARAETIKPLDLQIGSSLATTFYLKLNSPKAAQAAAEALQTPGSATYHQFLSVAQFVAQYGPTPAQLASFEANLAAMGFTVTYVYPNNLAVEAVSTTATASRVLGLTLHSVTRDGRIGTASTTQVHIPASIANIVEAVGGFDTVHHAYSNALRAAEPSAVIRTRGNTFVGGTPGAFLPQDFESTYNVTPILSAGTDGTGTTIGIVTLNNFLPYDAYQFWKNDGLTVASGRITLISVDGGQTAPTNNSGGAGETTLDVEQSGAIASGAKIRVYIAPNVTNNNFINGFEAAASDNLADTVSTSWGQPELDFFPTPGVSAGADALLQAFHDVFIEMALQGQSVYAAAGDSGAYDTVRGCKVFGAPTPTSPTCNDPLAVDSPSNDPFMFAAGGTTLPFSFVSTRSGTHYYVNQEQAWSWKYFHEEAAAQGNGAIVQSKNFFAVGTGGGVSSYWPVPSYQAGVANVALTPAAQIWTGDFGSGPMPFAKTKDHYAGRNSPDLSANADPESGYLVQQQGSLFGEGGTSFVAPQFNGVTALFVQALGGRVGQLQPALYRYGSAVSRDITLFNNWGYVARAGYDQATGVGVLDAAALLAALQAEKSAP